MILANFKLYVTENEDRLGVGFQAKTVARCWLLTCHISVSLVYFTWQDFFKTSLGGHLSCSVMCSSSTREAPPKLGPEESGGPFRAWETELTEGTWGSKSPTVKSHTISLNLVCFDASIKYFLNFKIKICL